MTLPPAAIVAQAADRFALDPDGLTFVREAANAIYAGRRPDGLETILRLTAGAQRDGDMILGEMDWVFYLAAHDGRVAHPIRSRAGRLVETLASNGETWHAVLFEKIAGIHPEGEALTGAVLGLWGQALGHMHRLARDYKPPSPAQRRPHWHALDVFQLERRIPASQPTVRQRCRETLDAVRRLPVDREGYGLIHADPEPWNFFLHEDRITFIDFDDCCYHWFAFDIAVSMLYAVLAAWTDDKEAFSRFAWRHFYEGYRREHQLSTFWLEQIPLLMRLRLMEDYAFGLNLWDPGHAEDWQAAVMRDQRQAIEGNTPWLGVDWDHLFLGD